MKKLLIGLVAMLVAFMPSAFALEAVTADTKVLIHFDGADGATTYTTDDASARAMTRTGNGEITTDQEKWGVSSCGTTATGSNNMKTGDSADWDVGTGDYTLDAQVYLTSYVSGTSTIVSIGAGIGGGSGKGIAIDYGSSSAFRVWHSGSNVDGYASASNTGAWHHWRVQRKSGVMSVWRDGVFIANSGSYNAVNAAKDVSGSTEGFVVGGAAQLGSGFSLNGYVDEVRFDTVALNATDANFTPPAKAYGGKSGGPITMITTG